MTENPPTPDRDPSAATADGDAQPAEQPPVWTDGGRPDADDSASNHETDGGTTVGVGGDDLGPDPDAAGGIDTDVAAHLTLRERLARGLREDKRALVGAVVVVLFVVVSVSAPVVAPYGPETTFSPFQDPMSSSQFDINGDGTAGSHLHPLGTDSFGHDMLTLIVYGSRVSLIVAFVTVAFAFTVGTTIGLVAGYYGGWVDSVLMRYVDFQWAFPELILAVGLIAITGGAGLVNVVIAIGIAFIDDFARLTRGEVVSIREEEYITAARAVGMTRRRIMFREVLPNAVAPLIVQSTIMIPIAILAEAALSFLGLGVSPTEPTWGILISNGRDFIDRAWWISVMPGLAIMATVLSFNMLGDGLRDIFDVTDTEVDR